MRFAFGARWLASPAVIIQVLFIFEQPKRNKMASRFALISKNEILSMNEEAVPKNAKMALKFGVTVFNGNLFNLYIVKKYFFNLCGIYKNNYSPQRGE